MMDNSLAPHQTHNQKNDGKSTGAGGESCSIITPLCVVRKKDRNKFCGSLPNNLDSDDVCDFQHNQNCKYENFKLWILNLSDWLPSKVRGVTGRVTIIKAKDQKQFHIFYI